MDTSAIDNLLGQLRAAATTAGKPLRTHAAPSAPVGGKDFATLLKNSIDVVNTGQVEATRLARDFELGAPNVNLNDVMISMQKANLSFQEMVQVRNRLVSAYHDVMNMQV
jgi:flagellar hook-basal body complex protein FliE